MLCGTMLQDDPAGLARYILPTLQQPLDEQIIPLTRNILILIWIFFIFC